MDDKKKRHSAQIRTTIAGDGSAALLDAILASSTEYSIVATDLDKKIIAWNEGAQRIYGYTAQEVLGKKIFFLNDSSSMSQEEMGAIFDQALNEKKWKGEITRKRKSGNLFTAFVAITLRDDEDGKTVGYTIISTDLTERKRLEESLRAQYQETRETNLFLDNILESSTEYSIIATDLKGLILKWNEGARRNYSYTSEEMVNNKNISILHTPEDIQAGRVKKFFELVMSSGKAEEKFERVRKNGDRFLAFVSMSLRRGSKGQPVGYLIISRDITEQQRLDVQLRINQELEEQNKRVREANRLKSEFLANMSHELRTPLNGIIGFAELMYHGKVGPISPMHKEYLGDILTSSHHLLGLINDVLDLAKVEAGKMEFYPEDIDLVKVVKEVRDILRTFIAKKQIKCEVFIDPNLTSVKTDPAKFKQLLYNFLSNALKFTPEGGKVMINLLPEGKTRFRLEVTDTGIGIPKEQIGRLFVEFQQLDSGVAKKYKGTGLGLALTRRIVEAQGGKVGVESVVNEGSTFYALLPRQPRKLTRPQLDLKPAINKPISEKAPRILVIEDEPQDQATLLNVLANSGFAPILATNAQDAVRLIHEQKFDAITLDLLLPDMSGWDLLQEIRTKGLNTTTPTIVITVVAEKAASLGYMINDFLIKPVDSLELITSLEHAGVSSTDQLKTVLLIDTDTKMLELADHDLTKNGYYVVCKPDGSSGLEAAEKVLPDAVILDLLLPDINGFEFLSRFRQTEHGRFTPVIVWTNKNLSTNDRKQLQESAQAVLQKNKNTLNILIARLHDYLKAEKVTKSRTKTKAKGKTKVEV